MKNVPLLLTLWVMLGVGIYSYYNGTVACHSEIDAGHTIISVSVGFAVGCIVSSNNSKTKCQCSSDGRAVDL